VLARSWSYEDLDPLEEFDPREEFGPYEDLDPYEDFGPYEEFDLGFLFFTGGVMMTFTWRLSRHLLGTQIFFIGGPFLQLVPTYLANTSPFWFLNSL
jgi:hypothetical protein